MAGKLEFSANLGFLWAELPLPEAIHAAKASGFDAVECHWPYVTPAIDVAAALRETGLPMLGLNTVRGNTGENGLAALPGREKEARRAIDQAIEYADATRTRAVHVMAGIAEGKVAHATFLENLHYASEICPPEITLLIEPLNRHDAPGYFLRNTDQAVGILHELSLPGIKLMFDCYHVGRTEGDIIARLKALLPVIGHIQFAAVPDRGVPDHGEVDYSHIFEEIAQLGWTRPLGAEYRPDGTTENSLGWLKKIRQTGAL